MSTNNNEEKVTLPHHEQQKLCTTRLPYRQGRKLTAVKVYTVNNESNHLLIFGIPSLKLRQEAKALFMKFGKLLQFSISLDHPAESFTETYHAVYERIQSARVAKKTLDTTTFYGGALHICYAPELESLDETRQKLLKRQRDVTFRLKNLEKEISDLRQSKGNKDHDDIQDNSKGIIINKLNMGVVNVISVGRQIRDVVLNKNKRKSGFNQNVVIEKKFKPCIETKNSGKTKNKINNSSSEINNAVNQSDNTDIEIVDCTSVENETISNINEALNYKNFGNEIIRKIPAKPLNKIKFNIGNNSNKS